MNEQAIKQFLDAHKAPQDIKDYIFGKEVAEDFDYEKSLNSYTAQRDNFFKEKHRESVKSEYEKDLRSEIFASVVKPFENRIRQAGGFTKEDVDGKDWKAQFEMMTNAFSKRVEDSSKMTESDLSNELESMKQKFLAANEDLKQLNSTYEDKIKEIEGNYAQREQQRKVKRLFDGIMRDSSVVEFDKDPAVYMDSMYELWLPKMGYKLGVVENDNGKERLTITGKNGGVALSLDQNDQYTDPVQAIRDIAKQKGILKQSNGATGESYEASKNVVMHNGKKINTANVNMLKEMMGMK